MQIVFRLTPAHFAVLACLLLTQAGVSAQDATQQGAQPPLTIVIKDHKFEPNVLKVPAGQRIKLLIDNQDNSAEEFESHSLKVEKVIAAKSKATINVGPLKPGKYVFIGEFHQATASGQLIAE